MHTLSALKLKTISFALLIATLAGSLSGCGEEIDMSNPKSFSGDWVGFKSALGQQAQYNLTIKEDLSFNLDGPFFLNESGVMRSSGNHFDLNGYCINFSEIKSNFVLRPQGNCNASGTGIILTRPKSIDYFMSKYVFDS